MDRSLLGTLIAGVALLPWIVEILWQVRLQARFLDSLPAAARAALPPHPRHALLSFLGSARFQLAVWRSFRNDLPHDPQVVATLKRQMRASLGREIALALGGLAGVERAAPDRVASLVMSPY